MSHVVDIFRLVDVKLVFLADSLESLYSQGYNFLAIIFGVYSFAMRCPSFSLDTASVRLRFAYKVSVIILYRGIA